MSYDASKDKIEWQKDLEPDGKTGIEMSVCRYDGGPPKISMHRFGMKKNGERYYIPKLGRLSVREMQQVVEAFSTWKKETGNGVHA